MAQALLEEVAINASIEPPELTQDWGTDSWRHKQNPVHQDPGEGSSDPTGDWPRLPLSVQGSPEEVWVGGGLLQGRGH